MANETVEFITTLSERCHTDMLVQVKMTSDSGGDDFQLRVTLDTTELGSAKDAVIKSPTIGTVLNNVISGISIPTRTKQVDFGFIIQQRHMIEGDHSNLVYTLQGLDSGGSEIVGCSDTDSNMLLCKNFDDLGTKDLHKMMIGAGKLLVNYKDMGFYTEDGIEIIPTQEFKVVKSGNTVGNMGAKTTLQKWEIKATLMQNTCQNMLLALNLTGPVVRSTDIRDFGGTRSGEYVELAPKTGWLDTMTIAVHGHAPAYDGKDMGWLFPQCSVMNSASLMIQAGTEQLIPVTWEAWIDANATTPTFGKYFILDKE